MRRAFSLWEVLVGILIFTVAILGLFSLQQFANRQTMDSSSRLLSLQLAQEPLEVCQGLGYARLLALLRRAPDRPLACYPPDWVDIPAEEAVAGATPLRRPPQAEAFQRRVVVREIQVQGVKGIAVNVALRTKVRGWWAGFLAREVFEVPGLIPEGLP